MSKFDMREMLRATYEKTFLGKKILKYKIRFV